MPMNPEALERSERIIWAFIQLDRACQGGLNKVVLSKELCDLLQVYAAKQMPYNKAVIVDDKARLVIRNVAIHAEG